jgi:phenylacetyl-CoA:acceptor oxidoreductase subunit 2
MSAVALGLMAAGLLILLFKIGRPLRFLYVLRQPQRSWMSREAWIAGFLFPLGCLFLLTGWLWAGLLAALSAAGFLLAQAMILKEAKGVPAWRTVYIIPFIIVTGFAEGAALLSLLVPVPIMLAALVLLRGLAWHIYLKSLRREGAPTRALTVLDSCNAWFLWGGVALPAALIALDLTALAGVAVVASGYALKFILITRAGYQQGFALQRAGGLVKPGWTPAEKST